MAHGRWQMAAAVREFLVPVVGLTEGFDRRANRQQLGLCYRAEGTGPLPAHSFAVQDTENGVFEWIPVGEIESRSVHPLGLMKMLDGPHGTIEHSVIEWATV